MKKCLLMCAGLLLTGSALANETNAVVKPVVLSCPSPAMPAKAAAMRITGSVQYQLWVNEKGDVYSISLTGDKIFYKEVESALKKCKFEPGKPGVHQGNVTFKIFSEGEVK